MKCPHGEQIKINQIFGLNFYLHECDDSHCSMLNDSNTTLTAISEEIIKNAKIDVHFSDPSLLAFTTEKTALPTRVSAIHKIAEYLNQFNNESVMRIFSYWVVLKRYNAILPFMSNEYISSPLKAIVGVLMPNKNDIQLDTSEFSKMLRLNKDFKEVAEKIAASKSFSDGNFINEISVYKFSHFGSLNYADNFYNRFVRLEVK